MLTLESRCECNDPEVCVCKITKPESISRPALFPLQKSQLEVELRAGYKSRLEPTFYIFYKNRKTNFRIPQDENFQNWLQSGM